MMSEKIFLSPRSSYTASKHFKHTIDDGLPYKEVEEFLDEAGKNVLNN